MSDHACCLQGDSFAECATLSPTYSTVKEHSYSDIVTLDQIDSVHLEYS